jgi:hypothetical protein
VRGRAWFLALLGGITVLSSVATFELLSLIVGDAEPVPVTAAPKMVTQGPAAGTANVVPTPAPEPTSPTVVTPTPAATKVLARVRPAHAAFLRAAPQLGARLVLELPPDDVRGQQLEVRAFAHGDSPVDPSIAPEDQVDVWYQVVWPPASPSLAWVHCSALIRESSSARACDVPNDLPKSQ